MGTATMGGGARDGRSAARPADDRAMVAAPARANTCLCISTSSQKERDDPRPRGCRANMAHMPHLCSLCGFKLQAAAGRNEIDDLAKTCLTESSISADRQFRVRKTYPAPCG